MPSPDVLIKNCTAADFEFACPKQWSELKPSMMAAVRDCHHCNRKVYLCSTDADLKLYTSLKHCIAVIKPQTLAEKEREPRTNPQQRSMRKVGNQWVEVEALRSPQPLALPTRQCDERRCCCASHSVPRCTSSHRSPCICEPPSLYGRFPNMCRKLLAQTVAMASGRIVNEDWSQGSR